MTGFGGESIGPGVDKARQDTCRWRCSGRPEEPNPEQNGSSQKSSLSLEQKLQSNGRTLERESERGKGMAWRLTRRLARKAANENLAR